jgi:hypothetical protein
LSVKLNVLMAQGAQARSFDALGVTETYSPGEHSCQVEQEGALMVTLNMPVEHGRHSRSEVSVPGAQTTSPGAHAVHCVQAVASGAAL